MVAGLKRSEKRVPCPRIWTEQDIFLCVGILENRRSNVQRMMPVKRKEKVVGETSDSRLATLKDEKFRRSKIWIYAILLDKPNRNLFSLF